MSEKIKIVWRISEKPTGKYRSFQRRDWPSAEYANGKHCAGISCEDDYVPRAVRENTHAPLKLIIADYSAGDGKWKARRSKAEFTTLKEAKAALVRILEANPQLMPKE